MIHKICLSLAIAFLLATSASASEDAADSLIVQPVSIEQIVLDTKELIRDFGNRITTLFLGPQIDEKELQCLAKNIFFEARGEPEEGKVAVGMVTINRSQAEKFPSTLCDVVNQRSTVKKTYWIKKTTTIKNTKKTVQQRIIKNKTVCQFSWRCMKLREPHHEDLAWQDSLRIAEELLAGDAYDHLEDVYGDALYFHATYVKPRWAKQKIRVKRVGRHIFYTE
jgi:spore germination cell wall hydrolase CwlJ-like protein